MMSQAEGQQRDLIRSIECLPASGHLTSLDQDLLMLKATSMATMNCLNDCFHILQLQHASQQKGSLPAGGYRCSQRAELCNKYTSLPSCKNVHSTNALAKETADCLVSCEFFQTRTCFCWVELCACWIYIYFNHLFCQGVCGSSCINVTSNCCTVSHSRINYVRHPNMKAAFGI